MAHQRFHADDVAFDRHCNRPGANVRPSLSEDQYRCFRAGDHETFGQVVQIFAPRLRQVVGSWLIAADDIDDVLQEAWIRAYDRAAQFSGRGSLEGWLRRICQGVAVDFLRSHKQLSLAIDQVDSVVEERELDPRIATCRGLHAQEFADFVDDAIMALPSLQRNVAALRWLFGWRTKRIATHLCVAPGTVRAELFRA